MQSFNRFASITIRDFALPAGCKPSFLPPAQAIEWIGMHSDWLLSHVQFVTSPMHPKKTVARVWIVKAERAVFREEEL